MTTSKLPQNSLETLLQREDVWRGFTPTFTAQKGVETGFDALNKALLHGGWPLSGVVEVCQQAGSASSEWHLLLPLLRKAQGCVVLLNPPALPFAQGLVQAGLDLDRVLVVQSSDKAGFIKSFVELSRTSVCDVLLAWQPQLSLSYTELRKCSLASSEGQSVCVLFRSAKVIEQSSPASLRLLTHWQHKHLGVRIYKQKGALAKMTEFIPLPIEPLPEPVWSSADFADDNLQTARVVSLFDGP